MTTISTFFRFFQVIFYALRFGLDGDIPWRQLPWYWRSLRFISPGWWFFSRQTRAQRLLHTLEALGPVFIKVGQLLSTRPDLLADDYFEALKLLQDKVPPINAKQLEQQLARCFPQGVDTIFKQFSHIPLASASIAQVHSAQLQSGEHVVIKLIRPNIAAIIQRDFGCMTILALACKYLHKDGVRLHPVEVVNHYKSILSNELNLEHEAANTALLREHFINSNDLYVPQVYWEYTSRDAMCQERIQGISIGNIAELRQAGVDFKRLAERAVKIFFTQLLENNFFHADMHPGNIFIDTYKPHDPTFIAVDCAIMGSLDRHEKIHLAQLIEAVFKRDYTQAAHIFIRSQWVDADTNIQELAAAIRTSNEPVFAKPIEEISFANQLLSLFATGRRFNMQVQPSLVLLQKTLFNIEGLGKQLYPQLDLWQTAQPFINTWLQRHYSPLNIAKRHAQLLPQILDKLPDIIERQLNSTPNTAPPSRQSAKTSIAPNLLLSSALIAVLATLQALAPSIFLQHTAAIYLCSGVILATIWFNKFH